MKKSTLAVAVTLGAIAQQAGAAGFVEDSKATLGLLESSTALPPGQTRASQDVIRQYENAEEEIPDELQPENQDDDAEKDQADDGSTDRSVWSYMTFGVFD